MIDEEVYRRWAEIDESGVPGNPWGIAAQKWLNETGKSAAEAVDRAILGSLRVSGDMRPLAALFYLGEAPSKNVLRYVAKMVAPELAGPPVAYTVETRRIDGGPGRPREFEAIVRDEQIRERVAERLAAGKPYKAAVSEVAEMLEMKVDAVKKIAPQGRPEKE
jgi:hypothetical protein